MDRQSAKLLEPGRQLAEKGLEDRSVQEQARPGRAGLSLTRKPHPGDHTVHRAIVIGIREDDRGALATQLQRDGRDAVRRRVHDELSDFRRPGERQLADQRVVGERGAALLAVARHQVDHARRQMSLQSSATRRSRKRRVLCRLQDERVAGGNRHRDLERAKHHGSVPRHDAADDADRFAPGVAEDVLAERYRFSLQLAGDAAEVAEDVDRVLDFRPGLGANRVAGFLRERARESLDSASIASAMLESSRPRSRGATIRQVSNAAAAPRTAESTSTAVARGTWAIVARLAGFSTSM